MRKRKNVETLVAENEVLKQKLRQYELIEDDNGSA